MLVECLASRFMRIANVFAAVNFITTPVLAETVRNTSASPKITGLIASKRSNDWTTLALRLRRDAPEATFLGLKVRLPDRRDLVTHRDEVSVLLHCDRSHDGPPASDDVQNITDGCASFSIFATAPV